MGRHYISHDYFGHNYISHNYIGQNYIETHTDMFVHIRMDRPSQIGHNYIGHNYMDRSDPRERHREQPWPANRKFETTTASMS